MKKANFLCSMFLSLLPSIFLLPSGCFGLSATAEDEAASSYFGVQGGYFTCVAPEGWQSQAKDMPDYMTSELLFVGPLAGNTPVTISVYYYGEGNQAFQDEADFVHQNREGAEAPKTKLGEREVTTFEKEYQDLQPPGENTPTVLKDKYYVFAGKDRKGFFALRYTAPSIVYEEYLPAFEKTAESFKFVTP